jgi:SAM-dependent methyltransferase
MMSYFDGLLEARRQGLVSEHVHLGLFDADSGQTLASAQEAMSLHHLHHLAVTAGAIVVDVGCGFGGSLRLLDGRLDGLHLTGVNVDPRQIEVAGGGVWRSAVDWQLCDAAAFSDGRAEWADRILSLEAMFHFPDLAGFFAASTRALRPGGRMVASTILFGTEADAASVAVICAGFGPWPHPAMSLTGLCDLARAAGLAVGLVEDLAQRCRPGFDWMCPPCPDKLTDNPVIELRRLFEAGTASYPLLVLELRDALKNATGTGGAEDR